MTPQLYNDHFQNWKRYLNTKAQLIIADPPYNLGVNAYASNPAWYVDGDNKNGESDKAGREFFDTDKDFRPAEFMHFCSQMLRPEPKEAGQQAHAELGQSEVTKTSDQELESKKLDAAEVIEWLNNQACQGWIIDLEIDKFVEKFKKDFGL